MIKKYQSDVVAKSLFDAACLLRIPPSDVYYWFHIGLLKPIYAVGRSRSSRLSVPITHSELQQIAFFHRMKQLGLRRDFIEKINYASERHSDEPRYLLVGLNGYSEFVNREELVAILEQPNADELFVMIIPWPVLAKFKPPTSDF